MILRGRERKGQEMIVHVNTCDFRGQKWVLELHMVVSSLT